MILRYLAFSITVALFCHSVRAQSFTITKVQIDADKVILHYDLIDTLLNRSYSLNLYASSDKFISPLQKASGDIGIGIKPGGNKKIVWNAKEELGSAFSGSVALEVRGKVYVPFVKLDGFDDYKKFKRGKNYTITWTGGRESAVLNMDLYKGSKRITTFANIANVGNYKLKFDKVKPGRNYKLRISDSKNKDDVIFSEEFKIRRKVPLFLKLVPLAAIGYAVSTLSGSMGDEDIPDPVEPK